MEPLLNGERKSHYGVPFSEEGINALFWKKWKMVVERMWIFAGGIHIEGTLREGKVRTYVAAIGGIEGKQLKIRRCFQIGYYSEMGESFHVKTYKKMSE